MVLAPAVMQATPFGTLPRRGDGAGDKRSTKEERAFSPWKKNRKKHLPEAQMSVWNLRKRA